MRQLKITHSITSRESQSLEKYFREVDKIELLSPDEEEQLAILIRQGDKTALDKLVSANLRFVISVAKKFQGQGLSLPDLINEGNLGLIKAAEKFDPTRGFKFISFAVWWIRRFIIQALAEHARTIRLPLNKLALNNRIRSAQAKLEQQLERTPSEEELADAMGIEPEDISISMQRNSTLISLDRPLSDDEDSGGLMDVIANENSDKVSHKVEMKESLHQELRRMFRILNRKQKETLCYFFGIGIDYPLSLEEIARRYDLTTERVRQVKDEALTKLRNCGYNKTLRGFLGT